MNQLIVLSSFPKEFKTGSRGWHGKVLDPSTGVKYQVQAVEIGSKPEARKA